MINCASRIVHGPHLHAVAFNQSYPTIVFGSLSLVCPGHLLYLSSFLLPLSLSLSLAVQSFASFREAQQCNRIIHIDSPPRRFLILLALLNVLSFLRARSYSISQRPSLSLLASSFAVNSAHPIARLLDGFRYVLPHNPLDHSFSPSKPPLSPTRHRYQIPV